MEVLLNNVVSYPILESTIMKASLTLENIGTSRTTLSEVPISNLVVFEAGAPPPVLDPPPLVDSP
jgi:hypothetical protein